VGTVNQGQIYESLVGGSRFETRTCRNKAVAAWKRGARCLLCEVQFSCRPQETFSFLQFAVSLRKQHKIVQYVMHLYAPEQTN